MIHGLVWSIVILGVSCATSEVRDRYGVESNFASLIPARISVLPCRPWPTTNRYQGLPLSNGTAEETTSICSRFDEFVLDGFKNQPFMRGFSPKAVAKLLEQGQQQNITREIDMLWRPANINCGECRSPMSFYQTAVANQQMWRLWLNQLSKATRNADAALMPFVLYNLNDQYNDRGLLVSRRSIGIVLMLIDNGSGHLIWTGGRESYASNMVAPDATSTPPQSPPIAQVMDRIFVEDVWKEFPGRLFLQ